MRGCACYNISMIIVDKETNSIGSCNKECDTCIIRYTCFVSVIDLLGVSSYDFGSVVNKDSVIKGGDIERPR